MRWAEKRSHARQTWSRTLRMSRDQKVRLPQSDAELVALVAEAAAGNRRVSVVGTLHSQSPVAFASGETAREVTLLSLREYACAEEPRFSVTADGVATAVGTLRMFELVRLVSARGFALHTQPNVGDMSVAGSVCTSTHGGRVGGSLVSDCVDAVRVVGASGGPRWLRADDADPLPFRCILGGYGALGVLTHVRLRLRRAGRLAVDVARSTTDVSGFADLVRTEAGGAADSLLFVYEPVTRSFARIATRLDEKLPPAPVVGGGSSRGSDGADGADGGSPSRALLLEPSWMKAAGPLFRAMLRPGALGRRRWGRFTIEFGFLGLAAGIPRHGGFMVGCAAPPSVFMTYFCPVRGAADVRALLERLVAVYAGKSASQLPFEMRLLRASSAAHCVLTPVRADPHANPHADRHADADASEGETFLAVDVPVVVRGLNVFDLDEPKRRSPAVGRALRFLQRVERVFLAWPGARPHLAKLFGLVCDDDARWCAFDPTVAARAFTEDDKKTFAAVAAREDPAGVFANPLIDAILKIPFQRIQTAEKAVMHTT